MVAIVGGTEITNQIIKIKKIEKMNKNKRKQIIIIQQ